MTEFPRASASVPIEPASSEEGEAQGVRHDLSLNAIEQARELAGPAFGGSWLDEREEPHVAVTTDEAKKAIENAITNAPIKVMTVAHTFKQLEMAQDAITTFVVGDQVMFEGAFVALDEEHNRVEVSFPAPEDALKQRISSGKANPSTPDENKQELAKVEQAINDAIAAIKEAEAEMVSKKTISAPIYDIKTNQALMVPEPVTATAASSAPSPDKTE